MSADNGIYVAKIAEKDFRVCHTTAIDNVHYYIENNRAEKAFDYWKNEKPFQTKEEALLEGHKMEEEILKSDYSVLEYGVSYLGDFSKYFEPIINSQEEENWQQQMINDWEK